MNAKRALDEQIKRYRRMTGEERLRLALGLHELSCEVAREGIRRQNPGANASEVEGLLRKRLQLARGA
jgi:Rv0078B-related antitoxin